MIMFSFNSKKIFVNFLNVKKKIISLTEINSQFVLLSTKIIAFIISLINKNIILLYF